MQLIVRPLLHLLLLPLSILASLLALILINGIFLLLLVRISDELDPGIVSLSINGGLGGWIVVMLILGVSNWILKETLR